MLLQAGYQSSQEDIITALKNTTAAVCAKLKTDYGDDLRVYVVKYRKQDKYKPCPVRNLIYLNTNHDYSV
ncbi:MAG: hypothetical protein J6P84_06095, partial [Alphaproteobacteria bacterium]|nr:hypothetical protein [Alphaproteobacteria bacterium]